MKKRKSWLYAVFSVFVISVLVIVLGFFNDKKKDDNSNDTQDEVVEDDNNDNNNQEEPTEVYATSLTVNLPSTINIFKGSVVNLLSGYVQVQPSEMINQIKIEIMPRYNSSSFGLEFNNSTLSAKEVGTYNLKISVPRSETTTFNQTILITVYEEQSNAHITQTNKYLIKGEKTNICDLFSIKNGAVFNVETDSKITYLNNCFTAISTGASVIAVTFTDNYVQYVYKFDVTIKDQPQYTIVLKNVTDNTIEIDLNLSSVFYINYEIQNRDIGDVSQDVLPQMEDETIAYVEDYTYPLIKIRALEAGTTTLTLTCKADNSISILISIVVR